MKKIITPLTILLCLLLITISLYAEQTFERGFGTAYDDIGSALCNTGNTGFVVGGASNGFSAGSNYDAYYVKFGLDGRVLWNTHDGTSRDEYVTGIIEYTGGDLYAIGTSYPQFSSTSARIFLAKLNQLGNVLWTKTISDTTIFAIANELIKLPNGNLAICGRKGNTATKEALIMIVDSSGNVLQNKSYSNGQTQELTDLILTRDGNIAACTASYSGSNEFLKVYKFNLIGDTIWTHTQPYNAYGVFTVTSIIQDKLGFFCIGGAISTGSYAHAYYERITENGIYDSQQTSTLLADGVTDLAVDTNFNQIYSADSYYNGVQRFAIQIYDYTQPSPSAQFQFFRYGNYSINSSTVLRYANAISYKDVGGYPMITLVGGTRLSDYGDYDIAIVHTNDVLLTQCELNKPVISAKTSITICPGDSVLLSLDSNSYINHHWARLDGQPTMNFGVSSDSIWVKTSGYYFYIAFDADSNIRVSNQITVTSVDTPSLAITPSGPLNYCSMSGQTLNFSIATTAGSRYQWYKNTIAMTNDTNATLNSVSSGSYYCKVTTICNAYFTNTLVVNSNTTANAVVDYAQMGTTWSGYFGYCNYINPEHLNIVAVSGVTYQWYRDGVILNGATNNIITVNAAGNYYCILMNSCGGDTSDILTVMNAQLPAAAVNGGATSLCNIGDSIQIHQTILTPLTDWYYNNTPISGTSAITSIYAHQQGSYSFAFTQFGCSNNPIMSAPVFISQGTIPTINLGPDSTVCFPQTVLLNAYNSSITSYLWNTGGTSPTLLASTSSPGNVTYSILVTSPDGCINSDTITVSFDVCSNIASENSTAFTIYPSIAKSEITIQSTYIDQKYLIIHDLLGKEVLRKKISSNKETIDISALRMGIYMINIRDNNDAGHVMRFVKSE